MLIHSKKNNRRSKALVIGALAFLFLIFLKSVVPSNSNFFDKNGLYGNKEENINRPVMLTSDLYTDDFLTSEKSKIHSDENFSLYLHNELAGPTLMIVYKDSITKLQKDGRFMAILYLKDPSKWKKDNQQNDYISLIKERLKPIEKEIGNHVYYIFKFRLEHPFFDFDNLEKLRFIRDTREFGRFRDLTLAKDSLPFIYPLSNNFKSLQLTLKSKAFEKISRKRNEAVRSGVLITNDDDYVKAQVSVEGEESIDSEIRLKGDWTDHLEHESKWSYRIIPDGEKTLFGMRKFSIQHPKSRNFLWEWLFNKVAKDNDITGLRYDFLNVELRLSDKDSTIPMGIMALEEGFDKILIENNRRREGLILAFDESMIWDERKKANDLLLNSPNDIVKIKNDHMPIKVYNENKTLSDPVLSKQFKVAKNLMVGLRDGKLKLSEAFDVDKLTFYLALLNLFGGHHGLIVHNVKIYYNPVTHKLEPISFDSNSGFEIQILRGYPVGIVDKVFQQKLVENYRKVSSEKFIEDFLKKHLEEINTLSLGLSGEFDAVSLDIEVLQHNANIIRKKIDPSTSIQATLLSVEKKLMEFEVKNLAELPIAIDGLVLENGKALNQYKKPVVIAPGDTVNINFRMKKSFDNAFVSKKNKEGGFRYPKDLGLIKLKHQVLGSNTNRRAPIKAFSSNFERKVVSTISVTDNIKDFNFIEIEGQSNTLHFVAGEFTLEKTLFIPAKYRVKVAPGFQLDFTDGASIISYAPLMALGTLTNPIHFFSKDASGGGIFISSTAEKSILKHANFTNLSIPELGHWSLSGAVNFNEATVAISSCVFSDNRSEDALNIIRTEFTMDSSRFINTYSDAFDGDFVNGSITNSTFINSGNDGIDVSGSTLALENITIENPSDKGLSAGEGSTMSGSNIKISGGEIGVVSKDLSTITLTNITIENTRLGIACFQKKSEFGPGTVNLKQWQSSGIEVPYLIAENSNLIIDGVLTLDKSKDVIDKMYGNEYGKSSK